MTSLKRKSDTKHEEASTVYVAYSAGVWSAGIVVSVATDLASRSPKSISSGMNLHLAQHITTCITARAIQHHMTIT